MHIFNSETVTTSISVYFRAKLRVGILGYYENAKEGTSSKDTIIIVGISYVLHSIKTTEIATKTSDLISGKRWYGW